MNLRSIVRIIGILLILFSLTLLPPIAVSAYYHENTEMPFVLAFAFTLILGFFLWLLNLKQIKDLKTGDGFVIVVLFWFVIASAAAIPFALLAQPHLSLTDALFEAVSGVTTTGATILSGIDYLPHAIRYYRQQLQFLGGMGIIVLAVAILPLLGVGGMQLYRAESPGPIKDNKLTPRITETAKVLWYIYAGLTVICILAYWLSGMTLFDAIGDGMSTVATGGFSVHDDSFAFYRSDLIQSIAVVFMFLSTINYSLHFLCLRQRTLRSYWQDVEFKTYVAILFTVITIVSLNVIFSSDRAVSLLTAIFTSISMTSTTGLTSTNFSAWPTFIPFLLTFSGIVGGCAASTSGGIKVIRMVLLHKQGLREIIQLIHPRAVSLIKFGQQVLPERVIQSMWGFIAIFFVLFSLLFLVLLGLGLEPVTAFSALAASLSNTGAGIAGIASGYGWLSAPTKWVLMVAMLAGRLEIFTLVVLFTPVFWRR